VRIGLLLTGGQRLLDRTISLRGDIWAHNTSLTVPLIIEVHVPSQPRK